MTKNIRPRIVSLRYSTVATKHVAQPLATSTRRYSSGPEPRIVLVRVCFCHNIAGHTATKHNIMKIRGKSSGSIDRKPQLANKHAERTVTRTRRSTATNARPNRTRAGAFVGAPFVPAASEPRLAGGFAQRLTRSDTPS